MNNAIKHADAAAISIRLEHVAGQLVLEVRDNGVGVEPQADRTRGLGLRLMTHRCEIIGGKFSIRPNGAAGTCIACALPGEAMMRESAPACPPSDTRATVMIVDDHPLIREGLIAGISAQPDMVVCAEAADVEDAFALIAAIKPDVVIVDIALKNGFGLDLIKKVTAAGIRTCMLVVSAYEESLFAERALRAGARGYVSKQELQEKVIDAIRAVLRGERYVSAAMAQHLMARALAGGGSPGGPEALSQRELQVFQLIGRGKQTREIASLLNVSVHTIESHREHIRSKLQLANGTELVQHAVQWEIENR